MYKILYQFSSIIYSICHELHANVCISSRNLSLIFITWRTQKIEVFLGNIYFCVWNKKHETLFVVLISIHTLYNLSHSIWICNQGWLCILVKLAKIALLHWNAHPCLIYWSILVNKLWEFFFSLWSSLWILIFPIYAMKVFPL